MPIAKVQLPDGRIARFEVAEGTTPDQVMEFAGTQFTQKTSQPDYKTFARQEAEKRGLDPDMFDRLIATESNWNPNAVNKGSGAIGFGQLMPATAKELGVDPNDPYQNISGAAEYLSRQMKTFKRPELALAAYNAGPGRVREYGNQIPPFQETIAYVNKITGDKNTPASVDYSGMPEVNPKDVKQGLANVSMGVLRGGGSLLSAAALPFDLAGDVATGNPLLTINKARRQELDDQFGAMGIETDSLGYRGGQLAAEIYGTAGIPKLLAGAAESIPFVASKFPGFVNALSYGGMGPGSSVGENALAGAVTGYVSGGAVSPESAPAAGIIGGALAPLAQGVNYVHDAAGNLIANQYRKALAKYSAQAPLNETVRQSVEAGYVIPPAAVNPSWKNRVLETLSGKIATGQMASTKNAAVTDKLARKALGLADDAPLSAESLSAYRKAQFDAGYEPIRDLGGIKAGDDFNATLDEIASKYTGKGTIPAVQKDDIINLVESHKSDGFDASDAVDAVRILRENANEAFRKGENALGKANKSLANAYEDTIEKSLEASGNTQLLSQYRESRKNIAKSFTVENAVKEGGGNVDARVIGRDLQKGKPLTGELETIGRFGNNFGARYGQTAQQIGSPGVHKLQNYLAMMLAGGGYAKDGPEGLAYGAIPYAMPSVARAAMFRKGAQNSLIPKAPMSSENALLELLSDPGIQRLIGRSAPVAVASQALD